MPKTPTQLGSADGSVTALLPVVRDYSDDFMRRTDLPESARQEYKAAWYKAFNETQAAFRIGGAA